MKEASNSLTRHPGFHQPGFLVPLLRLALPVMAEEFLNLLVGYVDWWLTGQFLRTTEHQAAMGLMAYVLWLIPSLFSAVSIGATALIARMTGNNDSRGSQRVLHQAFIMGAVIAVFVSWSTHQWGSTFIRWMQLDPSAAPLAEEYIAILAFAIPAIMVEQVAIASLRGAGDTVTGLRAKIVVNVANMAVCYGLVTGWWMFPEWGWRGLAVGSSVGHFIGAVLLLLVLMRGQAGLKLELRQLTLDSSTIRRLIRVGLPGGVDVLAVLTCHLIYYSIVNTLGKQASAGHGLGVQIEALAYCPGSAFQVAIATIAGQLLGADNPGRASRAIRHTCLVALAFYSVAGCVFYAWGLNLAGIFTIHPQDPAAHLAAAYLATVAFSMPSLALVMVLSGAMRGVGDTAWLLAITFAGLVLIRIPFAYWLAWSEFDIPLFHLTIKGWGLGVQGAWYAMLIDVVLRSILLVGRYLHGGWMRIQV